MDAHLRNAKVVFSRYQSLWKRRIAHEPQAWKEERTQYLQLLQTGLFDEFFSLLSETPDVLISFFTDEFELVEECSLDKSQRSSGAHRIF